jgi:1-acyl-sn-glycerol-3-phosphate acyltransferase
MRILRLGAFFASALACAFAVFLLGLIPSPTRRLKLCSRVVTLWSRYILRVFRIQMKERPFSRPSELSRPRVIIANHVSYLDIPVLFSRGPAFFIAKKEVSTWPIIGGIARRAGVVFVDRGCLWSRAHALLELQSRLQLGVSVVVFPEGTTSVDGPRRGQSSFHAGAFRLARMESAPIEIVYIDYADEDRCAWVGHAEFLPHLLEFAGGPPTTVRLRTDWIANISTRRRQRVARDYSRGWMLDGGRDFKGLSPTGE